MYASTAPALLPSLLTACLLLAGACSGDDDDDGGEPVIEPGQPFAFADGFETADGDFDALFSADGNRWTATQLVHPAGGTNALTLVNDPVLVGDDALRVLAKASTPDALSKAGIEKGGFAAGAGASVTISAGFYLAGAADLTDLLLLDLECCACWDPAVPDNQCPGVRLVLKEGNYLAIERGKILGTTLRQTRAAVPRNAWFRVRWAMTLSPGDDGVNCLSVDGLTVIDAPGANLPDAGRFAAAFAAEGIDFALQEPVAYERFQIGATANPTGEDVELYVDDVRLEVRY